MKLLRTSLLLLFALMLSAATHDRSCDDARLKGNRYFGAMRAALTSGAIQIADVERAIGSDEPYQALANITPDKHQIIAKHLFADLVKDPEVRATWPQTKTLLADLLRELQGQSEVQEQATRATAKVLAPREIHSFDYSLIQQIAWTEFDDGTVGFARYLKEKESESIQVLSPTGTPLLTAPLPSTAPGGAIWKLGWHRDDKGTLWLYIAAENILSGRGSSSRRADNYEAPVVYRLNWTAKSQFMNVIMPKVAGFRPTEFRSVGSIMALLAEYGTQFDVSGPAGKDLPFIIQHTLQSAVVDNQGGVHLRKKFRDADSGMSIVFKLNDGTVYEISDGTTTRNLEMRPLNVPGALTKSIKTNADSDQLLATERADGTLLVGRFAYDAKAKKLFLSAFAPFVKGDGPIFEQPIAAPVTNPHLHWISAPDGRLLLACVGKNTLAIADIDANSMQELPVGNGFEGWFSAGGQTYFWTNHDRKLRIHALFSETRR